MTRPVPGLKTIAAFSLLALVAGGATGCGGSVRQSGGSGLTSARPGGRAPAPPSISAATAAGRHLFTTQCSACHTISGTGVPRTSGGELAGGVPLSERQVAGFVAVMPLRRRLTPAEARAVSAYVAAALRRLARAPGQR